MRFPGRFGHTLRVRLHLLGVEAVQVVPSLVLLCLEPALDQGKHSDEDREECDNAEAEEGYVTVIDPASGTETVGGQGVCRGHQDEKGGKDSDH